MENEKDVFAKATKILRVLKETRDTAGIIEFKWQEPGFSFHVRFPDSTAGASEEDVKITELSSNKGVKQQAPEQSRSIRFDPWGWKRSKKFNGEED